MLNDQCVSNSQFSSVGITQDDTSCWTSCGWWIRIVSSCTTLASMNKHIRSTTHLRRLLRLQVKSTRPLYWWIMHGVFAISKFVDSGWKWSSVRNTLICRIVVSSALPTVSQSIDSPFPRTAPESSSVLIIVIGQRPSGRQGLAAILSTRGVSQLVGFVQNKRGKSKRQLSNNHQTYQEPESLHVIGIKYNQSLL